MANRPRSGGPCRPDMTRWNARTDGVEETFVPWRPDMHVRLGALLAICGVEERWRLVCPAMGPGPCWGMCLPFGDEMN